MPIWIGATDRFFWSYHHAEITNDEWNCYLSFVRQRLVKMRAGDLTLTVTHQNNVPNALQRNALVEVLRSPNSAKLTGHAFVAESRMLRGVITAMNWAIKKPYLEETFARPPEAIQWLGHISPGFDAQEIWRDIVRNVPPKAIWREAK